MLFFALNLGPSKILNLTILVQKMSKRMLWFVFNAGIPSLQNPNCIHLSATISSAFLTTHDAMPMVRMGLIIMISIIPRLIWITKSRCESVHFVKSGDYQTCMTKYIQLFKNSVGAFRVPMAEKTPRLPTTLEGAWLLLSCQNSPTPFLSIVSLEDRVFLEVLNILSELLQK